MRRAGSVKLGASGCSRKSLCREPYVPARDVSAMRQADVGRMRPPYRTSPARRCARGSLRLSPSTIAACQTVRPPAVRSPLSHSPENFFPEKLNVGFHRVIARKHQTRSDDSSGTDELVCVVHVVFRVEVVDEERRPALRQLRRAGKGYALNAGSLRFRAKNGIRRRSHSERAPLICSLPDFFGHLSR